MKKNRFMILVMICLIVGCTSSTTPTPLQVESQTPLPSPTLTASSTATQPAATLTVTPEASLRTNGPYFTYFRKVNETYQFVMMDADGNGRKVIQVPDEVTDALSEGYYRLDVRYISPDGKWLAFHTGSAGAYDELLTPGPFDLALNLLNLETGEKHIVTHLVSKDYPENFRKAAKQLNNPDITPESLQGAFLSGITNSIAWSPDGRHLAFAGQMDGWSSDLYVYDLGTGKIRRLSSGNEEMQWINWSPDGKWILHGSVFWVGEGMTFDIYAAAADGSSVRYLSTSINDGVQKWLNPHVYVENDAQNGPGHYGLRLVDVDTGTITGIWEGSYGSYAIDKDGRWMALIAYTPGDISPYEYQLAGPIAFSPGLYLTDLTTLETSQISSINDTSYVVGAFGVAGQEFIVRSINLNKKSYFLSDKGELIDLDLTKVWRIRAASDNTHWIMVTDQTVNVYSGINTLLHSFPLPLLGVRISDLVWSPDMSGVFLLYDTSIYSMNLSNGETKQVESNLPDEYLVSKYKWIGGQ